MPHTDISQKEVQPQPILFIRRRAARAELPSLFAECFGKLFGHCMQAGHAIAGNPMARYVETGQGLLTVDSIVPLLAPVSGATSEEGEMEAGELQGGMVAFTVHSGPYDKLVDVYPEIERWMEANGVRPNGAPWEWYVTDPAAHPDPSDWKTEIFWPIAPVTDRD